MAATEDVLIFKVNTQEAVQSVGDLKNNIKILKKDIDGLTIGTTEYQKKLNELKQNQNALKDAMYATSGSMEDVAKAASGMSDSYNSLVHQMAALKEEWRATNDEARRNELSKQIGDINQKLKDMDASVGNFQRNVGNYESGVSGLVAKFDSWGTTLKQFPPTLGPVKESIGKVGEAMQLVGTQPILGIIGLLAPIIRQIVEALQDNETAMGAVNKAMEALQPVMNIFSKAIELIAEGLSSFVDWIVQLAGDGGWFGKFTRTITGVGNAILQYLLTPVRTAIAAFKGFGQIVKDIFTGDWGSIKEHASTAAAGIKSAFEQGFSFKDNYEYGQELGEKMVDGLKSKKAAAAQAGAELQSAFEDGLPEEDESEFYEGPDWDYVINAEQRQKERDNAVLDAMLQGMEERDAARQKEAEMEKAVADGVTEYLEEQNEKRNKSDEERKKNTIATLQGVADATSGILSSIADMYESDEDNAKKNAKKIKDLRIASATIDMLNGAIGAFTQASASLPPPFGQIVGAASAAAVVAMGVANIAKIKATNVDSPSEGGGAVSAPASVSAPNIETQMPTIRTATSASEEDRLNRMASSQKVYILQSDIEAASNQSKVQVAESSF